MTTSPPSEGPSPEERLARELADMLALHVPEDFPREETARRLLLLIVPALQAAKRSAHLEDARAGCRYCAGDRWSGYFRAEPEREPTEDGAWVHDSHDVSGGGVPCLRPEVWDALSLPPGGAK